MKIKLSNRVRRLVAAAMMAAFGLLAVPSRARADQPGVSAGSPSGAQPAVPLRADRSHVAIDDRLPYGGARDPVQAILASFLGGGHRGGVYVGSTVVIILLVVLIVILL